MNDAVTCIPVGLQPIEAFLNRACADAKREINERTALALYRIGGSELAEERHFLHYLPEDFERERTAFEIVEEIFSDARSCEECPFLRREIDVEEFWGAPVHRTSYLCEILEDGVRATDCPAYEPDPVIEGANE